MLLHSEYSNIHKIFANLIDARAVYFSSPHSTKIEFNSIQNKNEKCQSLKQDSNLLKTKNKLHFYE